MVIFSKVLGGNSLEPAGRDGDCDARVDQLVTTYDPWEAACDHI